MKFHLFLALELNYAGIQVWEWVESCGEIEIDRQTDVVSPVCVHFMHIVQITHDKH
jgi:hypothetical protein